MEWIGLKVDTKLTLWSKCVLVNKIFYVLPCLLNFHRYQSYALYVFSYDSDWLLKYSSVPVLVTIVEVEQASVRIVLQIAGKLRS